MTHVGKGESLATPEEYQVTQQEGTVRPSDNKR